MCKRVLLAGVLAVLAVAVGRASADVVTWVSASIGTQSGVVTGTDNDWGATSASSTTEVQLPNGSRVYAYSQAATSPNGGLVYAEANSYSVFGGNSADVAASACAYGAGDLEIIQGDGGVVALQLTGLNPFVSICADDPDGSATVAITLSRDGHVILSGMIMLSHDGAHNGTGLFALDNFDISEDDQGTYTAHYIGPQTVSAGLWLVNTPLDITFVGNAAKGGNMVQAGAYPFGGGNTGWVALTAPEGYSIALVPEPASMVLLLGGAGMLLGRRRRNAPCRAA
jgi:hypothetical protein